MKLEVQKKCLYIGASVKPKKIHSALTVSGEYCNHNYAKE